MNKLKAAIERLEKTRELWERRLIWNENDGEAIKEIEIIETAIAVLKKQITAPTDDNGINALVKAVGQNARDHGWWEGEERTFGELIALCHSELSEALQEYRDGRKPTDTYYLSEGKPEGIPSELADAVIRIMDMCDHYGIDLETAIIKKHQFNKTRPYRHGNKVI